MNSDSRFAPIGQGSVVWSAQTWVTKAASDFAAFDAIVIGDPGQPGVDAELLNQAILNRGIWSPQVTGNVLIISGDPEWHAGLEGAREYIQQGLVFAAESPAAGPGLYVASGALTDHHKLSQVLAGFGSFVTAHGFGQQVAKLASHPTLDCVTEEDLSYWGSSAHDGFHAWPAAFVPVALVADSPQQTWTSTPPLPDGYQGLVHVLARAVSGSLSRYTVQPVRDCVLQGQPATITVTLKNAAGVPLSGRTIAFKVESGPNALTPGGQPSQATRTTDGSGTASWTYTGQTGIEYRGEDLVLATWLNGAPAGCLPEMRARIQWAPVKIWLSATDPTAAEPATPGGSANTGTFTFTRTGDTSEALSVPYDVEGTASRSDDFTLNPDGTVFFAENVTAATVTVTPLYDTLPEAPETVVLGVRHDPACQYAAADRDSAAVTIQSATFPFVTSTAVDALMDESGNNSGVVRLQRTAATGPVAVRLQFSGTASYGADYLVFPEPDAEGHVSIPDGSTMLDLEIAPIPDTRSEMPHETVTLTVLEGAQSRPGSPASVTLNLLDDDPVSLPALGYKLTDLGAISSVGSYANGINTLPDGQGGWRGQVAGLAYNTASYPNYYSSGFRWNNGSSTYLLPPSGWGYQPWCSAYSINDASTTVGQSAFYYAGAYYSRACYGPVGQGTAAILNPLTTVASLENYALDLNQRDAVNQRGGLIVGHSPYTGSKYHAVVWIPNTAGVYGNAVDLRDLGNWERTSYATAINDYGEVVGRSQILGANNYHGFRARSAPNPANNNQWEPIQLDGSFDDMGTATLTDAHTSELNDINALGEMVGRGHVVGTTYLRAVYKAPYSGKDAGWYALGVLGAGTANAGTESVANAVSANGTIAGQSRLKVGASQMWRAFVLSNAGNPGSQPLVNLNDVTWMWVNNQWVLATGQGWTLVSAERINRAGWIVGYGTKAGLTRAFVLSPR